MVDSLKSLVTVRFCFRRKAANSRGLFALWVLCSLALLAGMAVTLPAQDRRPEESGVPTVTAVRTEEQLLLDGLLSEESWSQAPPVTGFLQKDPQEGAPASEKTEVRILFDTQHIYFGVLLYDSNPDAIRATELRRDNTLGNDDVFELILDTFHDRRNGYLFRINPLARIIHKFSTASPKSRGLTVLRLRRPPQRTIHTLAGHAWRNALRPAVSSLRDEPLDIIRAGLKGLSELTDPI